MFDQCGSHHLIKNKNRNAFPGALSPCQSKTVQIGIPLGNTTVANHTDSIFLVTPLIWTCQPGQSFR